LLELAISFKDDKVWHSSLARRIYTKLKQLINTNNSATLVHFLRDFQIKGSNRPEIYEQTFSSLHNSFVMIWKDKIKEEIYLSNKINAFGNTMLGKERIFFLLRLRYVGSCLPKQ